MTSEKVEDRKANTMPLALPSPPKGLCFDKNQFLGSNFSVDTFLHDHRNAATLETMRDDLGVYLKVLRSAMIELINKDYVDFVNLSANLIGLDKQITEIQMPLGQLREEILHVKECLSDAIKELNGRLDQRKQLREKKLSLLYLSETINSLSKLNHILEIEHDQPKPLTPETIERASSEFNRLKFSITKCERYLSPQQKESYQKINQILTETLGSMFIENFQTKNTERLQRCLHIFSSLDRTSDLEIILRKEVISPSMRDIICESSLQRHPNGLKGVYENILSFIDNSLKDLLSIVTKSRKFNFGKYNLLLNSFWPEVESRIELNLTSIFAPGNPETFYIKYNESQDFIKNFIKYLPDNKCVETFYEHSQYKSFQDRWNLRVYFQIRYQEIAGDFENTIINNSNSILNDGKSEFSLQVTDSCWKSLCICWEDGIFILALTHRFWKLNLQILSRFASWIETFCSQQGHLIKDKAFREKIKFLVCLYSDIGKLTEKFPELLQTVKNKLGNIETSGALEKSLNDSKKLLLSKYVLIKKIVVNEISSESIVHLKQIGDIPRLFRKTNRDIPNKPCSYVSLLLQPLNDFSKNYSKYITNDVIMDWLEGVFSILTPQYLTAVNDVLLSVQKTEESLKRLKQIRDKSTTQNSERSGVSDDDKIRIQIKVDIGHYVKTIKELNINVSLINQLTDLIDTIEKANSKSNI